MSAMFLPVSFWTSMPFFLSAFSLPPAQQAVISAGVKSSNLKNVLVKRRHGSLTWLKPLIELKFNLYV
jgi:hypothetical protein